MDMSQCKIVIARAHILQTVRVNTAHNIFGSILMTRKITTANGGVSGHNNGQVGFVSFCHDVKQALKETVRYISFVDIRDGNDISLSWNFYNQILLVISVNATDGIHLQRFPRRSEYVMLRAAVMIAGCYDNGHIRVGVMYFHQGIRKHSLNRRGRLRRMIDIATKQEHIWLLLSHYIDHLKKHSHLLLCSVVIVKRMTKMPIACMQYFHSVGYNIVS